MKLVSKYPFESLIFFVLLYYNGIILFLESTSIITKISFFFISVLIFLLIMVVGYTFRIELNKFRRLFFRIFLTGFFQNSGIITKMLFILGLGIIPFVVCSASEFLLTFLFTKAGGITIGFPLPVYSFTAGSFLFSNLVNNLVVYSILVYFIGRVISEDPDITDY